MNEATFNTKNSEITKNYIIALLEQLTVEYQNTKEERQEIAKLLPIYEKEFTVLEELELLTVNIRGYASQIKAQGRIKNKQEAIEQLKAMRLFDVGAIAKFYLTTNEEYKKTKTYIRMLDYLRLLIWEYLN